MTNLVPYLNWTPLFESYVIWCGSKNGFQKYACLKKIGLYAQNVIITNLGSIVNIIWGGGRDLYDHLMSTTIFTSTMNKIAI